MFKHTMAAAALATAALTGRYGWISDKFYFIYDAEAKRGWVYDGMVASQQKDAREVAFEVRSDTSYKFKWTMENLKGRDGSVDATYNATLFTARNRFSINGHLHGWGNQLAGGGTCKKMR